MLSGLSDCDAIPRPSFHHVSISLKTDRRITRNAQRLSEATPANTPSGACFQRRANMINVRIKNKCPITPNPIRRNVASCPPISLNLGQPDIIPAATKLITASATMIRGNRLRM